MHTDCCQLLFDLWQQRRRILKVQQRWEICTTSMLAPFLRLAYWKKKAEKCWWLFYESPFSELISRFDLSERWTARFKNVRLWKTPLMTISKPLAFCRLRLYQLITKCLKIVKIVSFFLDTTQVKILRKIFIIVIGLRKQIIFKKLWTIIKNLTIFSPNHYEASISLANFQLPFFMRKWMEYLRVKLPIYRWA